MNKKDEMLKNALQHYGLNETLGGLVNKEVLGFLNDVSKIEHTKNTPWCAAFVGSMLKKNGFEYSKHLTAKAYLEVGKEVEDPKIGDIVILWRDSIDSWKGHVGFYIAESEHLIYILGGNQNNTVCVKPFAKNRVISYQRPVEKKPLAVRKKKKTTPKKPK